MVEVDEVRRNYGRCRSAWQRETDGNREEKPIDGQLPSCSTENSTVTRKASRLGVPVVGNNLGLEWDLRGRRRGEERRDQ